jgi:glycosyltransferase involved in cell wall biosynthesis
MLSTDAKVFEPRSSVRERLVRYSGVVVEMHVIVFTKRSAGLTRERIGNLFLYPTNTGMRLAYFFTAYATGKKILSAQGAWLITAQDPFATGAVGYLLKRKLGTPLQLQVHTDFLNPKFRGESVKHFLSAWVALFLISRVDGVRAVSERIARSIYKARPKYPKDRVRVLPAFIDADAIRGTPVTIDLHKRYPDYLRIVLMASRLVREKDIPFALRVAEGVARKLPNTLFLIVGDGPERERIVEAASRLGGHVVIEPWTEALASYYKTADLFFLTSRYEGYGRAPMEAAIAGIPVVMPDVGNPIGAVVTSQEESVFVEAIVTVFSSGEARARILRAQEEQVAKLPTGLEYLWQYEADLAACRAEVR